DVRRSVCRMAFGDRGEGRTEWLRWRDLGTGQRARDGRPAGRSLLRRTADAGQRLPRHSDRLFPASGPVFCAALLAGGTGQLGHALGRAYRVAGHAVWQLAGRAPLLRDRSAGVPALCNPPAGGPRVTWFGQGADLMLLVVNAGSSSLKLKLFEGP